MCHALLPSWNIVLWLNTHCWWATATCEFCPRPHAQREKKQESDAQKESGILCVPDNKGLHNIGENMPTLFMELAWICGKPNWDQCTSHGLHRHLIASLVESGMSTCGITSLVESGMSACDIAVAVQRSSLDSQLLFVHTQSHNKRDSECSGEEQTHPETVLGYCQCSFLICVGSGCCVLMALNLVPSMVDWFRSNRSDTVLVDLLPPAWCSHGF